MSTITDAFSNQLCVGLAGKPKLFVCDFCRGTMKKKWEENGTSTLSTTQTGTATRAASETMTDEEKNKNETGDNKDNNGKNSKNRNSEEKNNEKRIIGAFQTKASDIRIIFGNTPGYSVYDGNYKGGYLIRSFTKVLSHDDWFKMSSLDELIVKTRFIVSKLLGKLLKSSKLLITTAKTNNNCTSNNNESAAVEYKDVSTIGVKTENDTNEKSEAHTIANPLVVVIGIDFKKCNKTLVLRDCANIKFVFHNFLGYNIIYMKKCKSNDEISFLTECKESKNPKEMKDINKFKVKWSEDEIFNFNDHIVENVLKKGQVEYDGLIYFITSHGSSSNTIYDSAGEEMYLDFIFDMYNNDSCEYLRNKPKIFILSCNGGEEALQWMPSNDNETENKMDNTMDNKMNNKTDEKAHEFKLDDETIEIENSDLKVPFWEELAYCKDSHFRFIWANPDGFRTTNDKNKQGSRLIQSVTRIFSQTKFDDKTKESEDLTHIIMKTKVLSMSQQKKQENETVTIIQDNNRIPYPIRFKKYQIK